MYSTQINRIKKKLVLAKKKDKKKEVFGAKSHKYKVKKPLTIQEVKEFETKYKIELPKDYVEFITQIGNQGKKHTGFFVDKSFAAPFYGIFPLGKEVDYLVEDTKLLQEKCIIDTFSKSERKEYQKNLSDDDEIYNKQISKYYAGILLIGSQGCSLLTGLILNGKNKGKVVYFSDEHLETFFLTYEANFLDWYERWLDEIISGQLFKNSGTFGFTISGNEKELFQLLTQTTAENELIKILKAIQKLFTISPENSKKILQLAKHVNTEIQDVVLLILTEMNYEFAIPLLEKTIKNPDDNKALVAVQAIYWYAKDKANFWAKLIANRLKNVQSEDLLNFSFYILQASNYDYSKEILAIVTHTNSEFRKMAFYTISLLKDNSAYEQIIKNALVKEKDENVAIQILQSIEKLNNNTFIPYYKEQLKRFEKSTYIRSNVINLLEELGQDYFDDEVQLLLKNNFNHIPFDEYDNNDLLNCLIDFRRIPLPDLLEHATQHKDKEVAKTAKKYLKKMKKKKNEKEK